MPPVTASPARPRPVAPPAPPRRQRIATGVALGAGAFCLVLAVALTVERFHHRAATYPLDHPRILQLKEELVRQPRQEQLKQEIRTLDLKLRIAEERYLTRLRIGQWLLLGGAVVFLAAVQTSTWRSKIARPGKRQRPAGWQAREIFHASAAVVILGLAAAGGAWWLAHAASTLLVPNLAQAPTAPVASGPPATNAAPTAAAYPTPEQVARNWGRFRGPGGAGVSAFTNAPLTWSAQTGTGILWKTTAPGPDFNSPVVWGDRLFLTSATARKREVFCYDALTGKLLWQKPVENVPKGGAAVELPEVSGGFACSTAATDGQRVYVMFANGDVAAFDFNGGLAWATSLAPIQNPYGHAASLDLWQDRLIIQLDHGELDSKVSKLLALNTADGKVVWTKPRETQGTWSTPITIDAAGKAQIITLGLPNVIAYAAADGAELWRVTGIDGEITPSPIYAGGLVLAPSPSSKLIAIKPDGAGDVTKTHVAWINEEGVPDITCPVSDGQRVYLLTTGGTLTACDLKTGKKIWEKDLELEFKASPTLSGDRLYLASSAGVVLVLAAGPEFKELARNDLGGETVATPALADGRIYFRTKTNLWCVGRKPE